MSTEEQTVNSGFDFKVKPTMQKAGITEFSLQKLDFKFIIIKQPDNKTIHEFVKFEPAKSFEENRNNILECLHSAFKFDEFNEVFTKEDLPELRIEITSIFAENAQTLYQIMKDNPFESEENKPKEIFTYKYAGSGTLYETIILEGKSLFIYHNSNIEKIDEQIVVIEGITEQDRIIRPMPKSMHVSKPYEFSSQKELMKYFYDAKKETLDTLLSKAKQFVKQYIIQPEITQNLLAISIIWTQFQDIFATTYYVNAAGDNNSGKTAAGHLIAALAYRSIKLLDPSATHVFRTLGDFEAGQAGALVLDEAEKINDYPDMMSTLKAGYLNGEAIPRTNTTGNYEIQRFFPYGWKIIISEKGLDDYKAKGVIDRTFSFGSLPGDPKDDIDITEVLESRPKVMSENIQRKIQKIIQFRKLLLMYRLLHYDRKVADITVGVKRRNRQLIKPVLQLFFGTKSQEEVENTFEHFLKAKNKRKENTLEGILIPAVLSWFGLEPKNQVIKPIKTIWFDALKALGASVASEAMTPDVYDSDLGEIKKKTIIALLRNKFSAENDRTSTERKLIFTYDKVKAVADNYEANFIVKCTERIETLYEEEEEV